MFVVAGRARTVYPLRMMTHDELLAELLAQMDSGKLRPKDVGLQLGLPSSRVSDIRKGRRRIQPDEMHLVLELLGLVDQTKPNGASAVRWVPLVGLAPAGNWREAIAMPMGEVPVSAKKAGQNAFAVEIVGDSMDLLLKEGGWAVIDPDQCHLYDRRVYLVMNGEHDATVKRYFSNPARLEPMSTNPCHTTMMLDGTPIRVIGRVVSYGNDDGL